MNNIEIRGDGLFIVIELSNSPDFPPLRQYIKVLDKRTFKELYKRWILEGPESEHKQF